MKPREFWISLPDQNMDFRSIYHERRFSDDLHVREVVPGTVTISREELLSSIHQSWDACGCDGPLSDMLRSIEGQLFVPDETTHIKTYCKDCGIETARGQGSARCKPCWEDRTYCPNEKGHE